jgi:hypothetical protein
MINREGYNKYFIIQNNFINIVSSQVLNNYIFKAMTNIPKIKTNFENNTDCINITDYQDAFVLFIEFIYKNKNNYSENEPELLDFFDSVLESGICDMRSYRVLKNESRRKKEKKLKKIKKIQKEQKEQKKSQYRIVKKNSMGDLNESSETDNINENDECQEENTSSCNILSPSPNPSPIQPPSSLIMDICKGICDAHIEINAGIEDNARIDFNELCKY